MDRCWIAWAWNISKSVKRRSGSFFDGLILPGGESTVMRKLLIELDIYDILKEKIEDGLPVFGTCAGLILLADQVEDGVNALVR